MTRKDWTYTFILFVIAFVSRIIPHYPNFTAIGAVAIAGGMAYRNWIPALLATVASMFVSDLLINNIFYSEFYGSFVWFTPGAILIYSSFIFSVFIPRLLSRGNATYRWLISSLASTGLFFLITNFGVWYDSALYPQTISGLLACYVAAIPFAINQLLGTLFYGALILLAFSYVDKRLVQTV